MNNGCECKSHCRCAPRWHWRVGERQLIDVCCPHGCCEKCPVTSVQIAESKLTIWHDCFGIIAELDNVFTYSRCDGCQICLPAEWDELTNQLTQGCTNCALKFELSVTVYESEPVVGEPLPETCKQTVERGDFLIDWGIPN